MAEFTVDTKLFQELGELLVGKESTALVELIKNAYDADATEVTILGKNLADSSGGLIVVEDDGNGMTADEFERGFLRIGGRTKSGPNRRSERFGRRFTGEKGIGRLAAHKLATKLQVHSFKEPGAEGLDATIDWATIEKLETLAQISESKAISIKRIVPKTVSTGTTLYLQPIRKPWTLSMVSSFHEEALTLVPFPATWRELPPGLVTEKLLFGEIPIRDNTEGDPGFEVRFHGDLAVPDSVTPAVVESASWVAEIEYESKSGRLRVAVAPTKFNISANKLAEGFRFERNEGSNAGPSFRGRIFQKSGGIWPTPLQGIRVYMEGFRVPPYGEQTNDWIGLDRTYRSRTARKLTALQKLEGPLPEGDASEELVIQTNHAYLGAVFLQRESAADLKMLVNREGFLPGSEVDFIAKWIRVTTDLIVRLGYPARKELTSLRKIDNEKQRTAATKADAGETPSSLLLRESALAVQKQLEIVESALKSGDVPTAMAAAQEARPRMTEVEAMAGQALGEAVLWRLLASLGTELAAFIHEINALAIHARGIVAELDGALIDLTSTKAKNSLKSARRAALELADRIKRNAAYLVNATSFQGRRRRSRLPLRERFETVLPFFLSRLEQRRICLENAIGPEIFTPPMFPAELVGIFTNLLSNAVKFAGNDGKIRVSAEKLPQGLKVTMENTGSPVDLKAADKLFEAFKSTTETPDAVLGQGMGLGLTITRVFVQEYGGEIRFKSPTAGFSTAIEFILPDR